MYCSNCGKKLSPEDYFCSNCGTPVLRQGLFDDNDTDAHEDAFEETRLFTAEELGKYLNDIEDEEPVQAAQPEESIQQSRVQSAQTAAPTEHAAQTSDKGAAAKAAAAEMVGAASAMAGKFKGKLSTLKAKQAEKKQAQNEARAAKAVAAEEAARYEAPEEESYSPEVVSESSDTPVSMKKIILPVVVLGLIIGLVIGLVLIQPWSSGGDTGTATEQTAVSTAMLVE